MNPSNTQVTPEIKKVIDSNGDCHTVIPTPHEHEQSEVRGLTTALDAKADTSSVNAALNGKASVVQVNAKASKVSGAVSGHFAGLDSNGDLTDSGKKASDFMPATAIDSTPTANSTNLVTSGGVKAALNGKMDNKTIDQEAHAGHTSYLISSHAVAMGLSGKADKVSGATNGNFAGLDSNGDLTDSGKKASDFMPATTIDSTPTHNSTNLVTSGGVYSALLGKASTQQLSGKEDKPLPLGLHCNDDTAELYLDDRDELYNVIAEVQSKLVMSTSNPKPVHVLIVLSYFDQQDNLSYKCAVDGELAIWTSGNNVHLSIIIGKSIYVMNGTYSIIEVQGQDECEVTISVETFYYESSI